MDTKNIRSRGRPPVDSERVCARIERPVLDALDAFAADFDEPCSRPEAIRRILLVDLARRGYLKADE